MSFQEPIRIDGTINFGKHKGQTVEYVLENHPDWLLWLRQQRFQGDEKRRPDPTGGMDDEVNECLDTYLDANKNLQRKYRFRWPGGQQKVEYADMTTSEDDEMLRPVDKQMEGWASW